GTRSSGGIITLVILNSLTLTLSLRASATTFSSISDSISDLRVTNSVASTVSPAFLTNDRSNGVIALSSSLLISPIEDRIYGASSASTCSDRRQLIYTVQPSFVFTAIA